MDLLDRLAVILLMLMASSFAAVVYQSPSPANGGTVIGNSASFNWSDSVLLCDHAIFILSKGGVIFDNETTACNATISLTNLSSGSYAWNVSEYKALGILLDSGANQTFTDTPYIVAFIAYPHSLTGSDSLHYYTSGDTCSQNITLNETDSEPIGAVRSSVCNYYYNNNGVWTVYQSLTFTGANHSYIFSTINNSGQYAANCSMTVSGTSNNSQTENITAVGVSFCSGNPDDSTPDWAFNSLAILGTGLLLAGVWWSI